MQYPEWIWHNGGIKPWAEATTHVMSHGLHYGSSVFEGIRAYKTPRGSAIFRLQDHNRRLYASARIHDMAIPYSLDELNAACHEVVRRNGLEQAYLRPVAWRGLGGFGLSADTPIDVAVASWHMGPYLGPDALDESSEWSYLISFLPGLKSAGGTESILKNTIGERVLGLPPASTRFGHGAENIAPDGRILLSSYHCSRYNQNTGRLNAAMFESVFELAVKRGMEGGN